MIKKENKSFKEELKRRIYQFILALLRFLENLPNNDSICRIVKEQLIRSGTSIGANYIEAIASSSKKEFVNFLSYSLKSMNESKFWLAILKDMNKGSSEEITKLLIELKELSNILATSIRTIKNKN